MNDETIRSFPGDYNRLWLKAVGAGNGPLENISINFDHTRMRFTAFTTSYALTFFVTIQQRRRCEQDYDKADVVLLKVPTFQRSAVPTAFSMLTWAIL